MSDSTDAFRSRIVRLIADGLTIEQAARKVRKPQSDVVRALASRKLEKNSPEQRATEDWVAARVREGMTPTSIIALGIPRAKSWVGFQVQGWLSRHPEADPAEYRPREVRKVRTQQKWDEIISAGVATARAELEAKPGVYSSGTLKNWLNKQGYSMHRATQIVKVISTDDARKYLRARSADKREWTPKNIAPILRKAARSMKTTTLSSGRYEQWRKTTSMRTPPMSTIILAYGTWADACADAGCEPAGTVRSRRRPTVCKRAALTELVEHDTPAWWPSHPDHVSRWLLYISQQREHYTMGTTRLVLSTTPGAPSWIAVSGYWASVELGELWAQRVWGSERVSERDLIPVPRRWQNRPAPDAEADAARYAETRDYLNSDAYSGFALANQLRSANLRTHRSALPTRKAPTLTWGEAYARLADWVYFTGSTHVPQEYVMLDGFRLGRWVHNQRTAYRMQNNNQDRTISDVRVGLLERFPDWSWKTANARHTGVTHTAVVRNAPLPLDDMISMFVVGMTFAEIGDAYGVSSSTISKRFREAGLPTRRYGRAGRLTLEETNLLTASLRRIAEGHTYVSTAAALNVDPAVIRDLLERIGVPRADTGGRKSAA